MDGASSAAATDILAGLLALLVALSVASERLVEIIKGLIPWLDNAHSDPTREGWRRAALQSLAVISGVFTAWLAQPALGAMLKVNWSGPATYVALGFLASGGSGLWNGVLT